MSAGGKSAEKRVAISLRIVLQDDDILGLSIGEYSSGIFPQCFHASNANCGRHYRHS
jgi:hypothetical protein